VRALPELEHDERPEPVAVVGAARGVFGEQPFDRRPFEPAAVGREHVRRELPQLAAEPARERHAEACLPAT